MQGSRRDGDDFRRLPLRQKRGEEYLEKISHERQRTDDADCGLRKHECLGYQCRHEHVYRKRHRHDRHGHDSLRRAQAQGAKKIGFVLEGVGARGG
jgi:hypothetical protein